MADETRTLIRFDGILHENHTFEPRDGWETVRPARRPPKGDGRYVIELRNAGDEPILEVYPLVDFEAGCVLGSDEARSTRVVAYVPLHPDARSLVFRYGARVLYRRPVARKAPTIKVTGVARSGSTGHKYTISWEATHQDRLPLAFHVVYLSDGQRRAFPLVRALRGRNEATVDISALPGGARARFAVLATDGVRSSFGVSKAVETAESVPEIFIVRPAAGEKRPFGQPVGLSGRAFDAGAAMPEEHLVWKVDGEEVSRGRCLGLATDLEPGSHRITLTYAPGGERLAERSVSIKVAPPNERHEQHQALAERIHAAAEKDPVVHGMMDPPRPAIRTRGCGCGGGGTH